MNSKERERKCFIDGAFAPMNKKVYIMIQTQKSEEVSVVGILLEFISLLMISLLG